MRVSPSLAVNTSYPRSPQGDAASRRIAPRLDAAGLEAFLMVGALRIRFNLIDVSAKGVSGKAEIMPDVGSRVLFGVGGEEPRRATVRWKDGVSLGLELDHPIDPERLLRAKANAKDTGRRIEPRYPLRCAAQLRTGWTRMPITLINLSAHGLRAEVPFVLRVGSMAEISTSFHPELKGQIRWCRDGMIGVQLDDRLEVNAFIQAAARAGGLQR